MSRAHGGWVWGVLFLVSGLYKFMGKLADRIFFGVQGVGFGVPFCVSGLYCIS